MIDKEKDEKSTYLGLEPIPKLLLKQALPAAIGFMVMSMNMIVDTYFVGQFIGELAIGAISVVFPISFLFSSIGMSIGIGGGSIVSRSLGAGDIKKALLSFNNQISLTFFLAVLAIIVGVFLKLPILNIFGAKGEIMPLADSYFTIVLYGIPFLAVSMIGYLSSCISFPYVIGSPFRTVIKLSKLPNILPGLALINSAASGFLF